MRQTRSATTTITKTQQPSRLRELTVAEVVDLLAKDIDEPTIKTRHHAWLDRVERFRQRHLHRSHGTITGEVMLAALASHYEVEVLPHVPLYAADTFIPLTIPDSYDPTIHTVMFTLEKYQAKEHADALWSAFSFYKNCWVEESQASTVETAKQSHEARTNKVRRRSSRRV